MLFCCVQVVFKAIIKKRGGRRGETWKEIDGKERKGFRIQNFFKQVEIPNEAGEKTNISSDPNNQGEGPSEFSLSGA